MHFEKTTNGIEYTEEPAGSQGAAFTLFPAPGHTKRMIDAAIAEIRRQRDVVHMRIAGETDWIEQYRHAIFRHPLTKHLRWFEMNVDSPDVLNYHRLKGTPVEEYITRFVLPCTAETKARNIERFGRSIVTF